MEVQLYEAGAIIGRKGGERKSGIRYGNYTNAIKKHLDWLFEQIDASKDGAIRIKLGDFAEATGFKMQKVVNGKTVPGPGLSPASIVWGFKYSLFHAGITTSAGNVEGGQPVIILRRKVEGDVLPASLQDKVGKTADETDKTDETDPEATDADEVDPEDDLEQN